MNPDSPAVELIDVSKHFEEAAAPAVHHVSLAIGQGEFFSLLGPSGCGKTTTLRMIAGFEHPTSGTLRLLGADIGDLPPHRRNVNMVFQNYALFPHLSVFDNVAFGLEVKRVPRDEIRRQVLDAPLGALDQKLRKDMQRELTLLQREVGITFIYVTHDQEEALTMSDRIAVMSGGVALQIGNAGDIYERPNCKFVADFIGETNFLNGKVKSLTGKSVTVELPGALEVRAESDGSVPSGTEVSVAVRPEKMHINYTGQVTNRFEGRVVSVVYIGTDTHYGVMLKGNHPVRVREQNNTPGSRPLAAEGDAVTVSF